MLRLHFTEPDLRRVRLADGVDPLWETVLSLHQLPAREGALAFGGWRTSARSWAADRRHRAILAMLGSIAPPQRYFPDFLTPEQGREGLDVGLDAILGTPRARLAAELGATFRRRSKQVPRWAAQLATGARDMRQLLVQLLRTYHSDVVLPYAATSEQTVAADRAWRAQALLSDGIDGLCGTFGPHARWERNVLQLPYPNDVDLYLRGRGVTLVPSFYCWGKPVSLADKSLAPVIVYPVEHDPASWCATSDEGRAADLGALLGCTRAEVLRAVARGGTPGRIALWLGIAPSVVSHHTTILRQAGLITTVRDGRWARHEVTPLGEAVLSGAGAVRGRPR